MRVIGDKGETQTKEVKGGAYDNLDLAIAEFFQTGKEPVDPSVTLEEFEFMDAAQLSAQRGGAVVKLEELRK